ncbi:MAG TPA: 2-C-methyl-D-erythritol 2,4-cyclodiphosphate synthase [Mariprofundaceae bacterium]|nr:2-C-methyl-D-erythritol 2,4-cyclodiphosphate synthase [Mariprofundaceae bacterium]
MDIRVGHGYDVHAFADGRRLVLGGVEIPHGRGLAGHSDADVLIHALCDAILGGAGLGDIGRHFPDTDERYRGADSSGLLRSVLEKAAEAGWRLGNADITVVAQAPKLAPYIGRMREHLASLCRVPVAQLNVKATTTERLGFAGREEGIAAHAVVLLVRVGEA